jgi:hypothetical protein
MRIQILNDRAQMTIKIDTTAASSIAVIPFNRDMRLLPCILALRGDLLFTEAPPKREIAYSTTLGDQREVYVKKPTLQRLSGKTGCCRVFA